MKEKEGSTIQSRPEGVMAPWRRKVIATALGGIVIAGPNSSIENTELFEPGSVLGEGVALQEVDYTIRNTNLHIVSWKDNKVIDEVREPIELTDEMDYIVNGQSAIYDEYEGYDPNYLDNVDKLDRWVKNRMYHPDVLRFAGVDDLSEPSASDLVSLAQAVVASNKEYDTEMRESIERVSASKVQIDTLLDIYDNRTKIPIDQLAMTDERIQCEMYALLTKTVFDSMKRLYPEKLTNTYMKTHEMTSWAHTVNVVSTVTADNDVTISVIDTTSSDNNPGTSLAEIGIADIALGYSGDYQSSNDVSNYNDTVRTLIDGHDLTDSDLETLFWGHKSVTIASGEFIIKGLDPEVSKKLSGMMVDKGLIERPDK